MLYRIEADARPLTTEQRLQMRQERSKPLWEEFHVWLQFARSRVPTGTPIAKAIDTA
jgi:transposase